GVVAGPEGTAAAGAAAAAGGLTGAAGRTSAWAVAQVATQCSCPWAEAGASAATWARTRTEDHRNMEKRIGQSYNVRKPARRSCYTRRSKYGESEICGFRQAGTGL